MDCLLALFETDAVKVCPQDTPFWYTSGKMGPFYINTHFLFGGEKAAGDLLSLIEGAAAGDRMQFAPRVAEATMDQYQRDARYRGIIDALVTAVKGVDCFAISGGERRDFFFSLPVAVLLRKPHIAIFKDGDCVFSEAGLKVSRQAAQAELAGKTSLHIADLVTEASSYTRAWLPAIQGLGMRMVGSGVVVDRDQGGVDILAKAGVPLTALIKVDAPLFDGAQAKGLLSPGQAHMAKTFLKDPDGFMRGFLAAHPNYLNEQLALGGKAAERAQRCIDMGFDKL